MKSVVKRVLTMSHELRVLNPTSCDDRECYTITMVDDTGFSNAYDHGVGILERVQ